MLKKFFTVMVLAAAIIFVGSQNNFVEAREVYVGTYSSGTAVYLLTESVVTRGISPAGPNFTCRVRAGRVYLDYEFYTEGWNANNRRLCYRNSEGYSDVVRSGNSPVEYAIVNYVMENYYG